MTLCEIIVSELLDAKEKYYLDTPIMSDEEFDKLEDRLRVLDPYNKYFSIVGTNVKGSANIKHTIPMLSCGKAKTVEELQDWMNKIGFTSNYVVMPKVDGLSCSIKYTNGKLSYISTRGNGIEGQEITWLKDFLNIPQSINPSKDWQEVRGEIYLPKNTTLETNGKPLRNIASGLVNRKDDKTNCEHLKFVAYQYYDSEESDCALVEDLYFLELLGFQVVEYRSDEDNTTLSMVRELYLTNWREKWLYETDGLVFQYGDKSQYKKIDSKYTIEHHNWFRWALKPPSIGGETTLLGIEWTTSKHGWVNPVSILEPIKIGDRLVSRATLDNYGNVLDLKLHKGDIVFVTVRNDVIPHLEYIVKNNGGERVTIEACPSCGSALKVVSKTEDNKPVLYLKCENKDCPSQIIKTITDYCVRCEMDSVAESTIEKLYYEAGIHSVLDLYFLKNKRDTLLKIEGFGESKVDNLLAQIEKSKKQTHLQLISNLGIEGVHEKGLTKLGIDCLEKLYTFHDTSSVNGQRVVDFVANNKAFITAMFNTVKPEYKETKVNTEFKGKVCMTGSGPDKRQILEAKLFQLGYESVDTVTKDTSILVVDDLSSTSSKMLKAQKLGVEIMLYEEFFK